MIRQPIVVCVGHIDHGKTTLLDKIRNTAVFASEAGGITQCISCSYVPADTIIKICGSLLNSLKITLTIPGLVFIDTPGHAAFNNLRKRGGSLADLAILVVDVNEGVMPQTVEAIEILKTYRTPFIVAANKIDLIPGFRLFENGLLKGIGGQPPEVQRALDERLYKIVAKLSEFNMGSERFDRVDDYTKQIAIVPCSAKKGIGIPEVLMVLSGLAQRFLEASLSIDVSGPAKATILEVKKEKGLGTTMDVIVYDGVLSKNDMIVIGSLSNPIRTKVKALFLPAPLTDSREMNSRFKPVESVSAAIGVKISAVGIEDVIGGMPLRGVKDSVDEAVSEVIKEVSEVIIETDKEGIVVKADALGSLEAITNLLKEKGISIRRASIGPINRKDVSEAESNISSNPLNAAILGFNVEVNPDVKAFLEGTSIKVFTDKVIYKLIDGLIEWMSEEKSRQSSRELLSVVRPCKIRILQGYVFRQSNPAIVGVEILAGMLRSGSSLMKEGRTITSVKGIQLEKENKSEIEEGKQAAVSLDRVIVGRQISEGEVLYSSIPEEDYRKLKKLKSLLTQKELAVLREIAEIMRKENPLWGV